MNITFEKCRCCNKACVVVMITEITKRKSKIHFYNANDFRSMEQRELCETIHEITGVGDTTYVKSDCYKIKDLRVGEKGDLVIVLNRRDEHDCTLLSQI